MTTTLLRIDTNKPDERRLAQVVEVLENDGVIIYPTDSVYTLGASIHSEKALKRICQIKGVKMDKAQFSIVCSDYSHLSEFAKQISNSQFRILKNHLPGPYTFILDANKEANKIFKYNKKTIGIRIPDYPLISKLIKMLDQPIFSASIQVETDSSYATTAEEIFDQYDGKVDLIIDGDICGEIPTTIVDLTTDPYKIIRHGAGEFEV